MNLSKSTNPVLSTNRFREAIFSADRSDKMTINGTVNKSIILLLIVFVGASLTWGMVFRGQNVMPLVMLGLIGGIVTALITMLGKPQWAAITGPLYAAFEGILLGAISALFEKRTGGITLSAVGLTFAVFFLMLISYRAGWIRATEKFKAVIISAILGIGVFYLLSFILGLFGVNLSLGNLGLLGIGISLVIVVVAALSLILDFDQIETNINEGAPKFMEWYSAFGLMVTLIWLYIEILRLLSLLVNRD